MLTYEQKDNVAYIAFNNPPANAYSLNFFKLFYELVEKANADKNIGSVIIKSKSKKFFCAGADIKIFSNNTTAHNNIMIDQARKTLAAMESSDKIFIAQISGHALGGGLEIAMACDIRFACYGSYKLGLPEIKLGLIPGNGGTQRLLRLVGLGRALELLTTGQTWSVEESEKWGLVNRLYEPQSLAESTATYASLIANGPRLAVAATKKALRQGVECSLADGLALEKKLSDELYDTFDGKEGFQAFLEKRTPSFEGR